MHQAKKLTYLRGVIVERKKFFCGICKKEHEVRDTAQACVYECLLGMNKAQPIQFALLDQKTNGFICSFCFRDFVKESDAHACARTCAKDYNRKLNKLKALKDLSST